MKFYGVIHLLVKMTAVRRLHRTLCDASHHLSQTGRVKMHILMLNCLTFLSIVVYTIGTRESEFRIPRFLLYRK